MENKQLIKGSLNTIILKLLSDNNRMYGYEITSLIKEMTKGEMIVTEGALYPALHKLEADGMITAEFSTHNGRKRKYYLLSEEGEKVAEKHLKELVGFIDNLRFLLNLKLANK